MSTYALWGHRPVFRRKDSSPVPAARHCARLDSCAMFLLRFHASSDFSLKQMIQHYARLRDESRNPKNVLEPIRHTDPLLRRYPNPSSPSICSLDFQQPGTSAFTPPTTPNPASHTVSIRFGYRRSPDPSHTLTAHHAKQSYESCCSRMHPTAAAPHLCPTSGHLRRRLKTWNAIPDGVGRQATLVAG